jgi:hypothetical protein
MSGSQSWSLQSSIALGIVMDALQTSGNVSKLVISPFSDVAVSMHGTLLDFDPPPQGNVQLAKLSGCQV